MFGSLESESNLRIPCFPTKQNLRHLALKFPALHSGTTNPEPHACFSIAFRIARHRPSAPGTLQVPGPPRAFVPRPVPHAAPRDPNRWPSPWPAPRPCGCGWMAEFLMLFEVNILRLSTWNGETWSSQDPRVVLFRVYFWKGFSGNTMKYISSYRTHVSSNLVYMASQERATQLLVDGRHKEPWGDVQRS